ncbi:MAG: hypothetical protein V4582_03690 [Pseudomonadota bacterium]
MNQQSLVMLAALPLIAWRMYSRLKRLIGRQKSVAWRHWLSALIFPALIVLLGSSALSDAMAMGGLGLGLAVGIGLAVAGLRLTKFENTAEGLFYTPNAHIGIALSLLFAGRVVYRMLQVFSGDLAQRGSDANFARSPITLLIFGMLAAYYVAYAVGILRWRGQQVAPAPAPL